MQDERRKTIAAHIALGKPGGPLSAKEQQELLDMAIAAISDGSTALAEISPQQPFRLKLMKALAAMCNDPDLALFAFLQQGVPTGVFSSLPTSHQWPPCNSPVEEHLPLQECESNRKAAEEEPAVLQELLRQELAQGWVREIVGGGDEAPQAIAQRHCLRPP